jgi:hypothetical protein
MSVALAQLTTEDGHRLHSMRLQRMLATRVPSQTKRLDSATPLADRSERSAIDFSVDAFWTRLRYSAEDRRLLDRVTFYST